jgi:hypothetical protein
VAVGHCFAAHGLAPQGFLACAEHGFLPAHGFFPAQGLQGFLPAHGFVFGAQGLLPATAGTAVAATMLVTASAELKVRRDFLNLFI